MNRRDEAEAVFQERFAQPSRVRDTRTIVQRRGEMLAAFEAERPVRAVDCGQTCGQLMICVDGLCMISQTDRIPYSHWNPGVPQRIWRGEGEKLWVGRAEALRALAAQPDRTSMPKGGAASCILELRAAPPSPHTPLSSRPNGVMCDPDAPPQHQTHPDVLQGNPVPLDARSRLGGHDG